MRRTVLALTASAALLLVGCEDDGQEVAEEPTVEAPEGTATPEGPAPEEPPAGDPEAAPEAAADAVTEQPAWAGPPDGVIGADVGLDPLLFRSEDAAVAINGMTVYDEGAALRIVVRTREDEPAGDAGLRDDPMRLTPGAAAPDPEDDEVLRLTLRYPDGREVRSIDAALGSDMVTEEPEGPTLSHRSSQGGAGNWDYDVWLWPLPEPGEGPFEVVAEWPAQGIDDTAELDVDSVSAAADRTVDLWNESR